MVAGDPDDIVLNPDTVEAHGLTDSELRVLIDRERPELARRVALYLGARHQVPVTNKTAIIVDDGMATGTTAKVAIRALRRRGPAKIVLALPVAPKEVIDDLKLEADMVVCLRQEEHFRALSLHYANFEQVPDEDVIIALSRADASYRAAHPLAQLKQRKKLE